MKRVWMFISGMLLLTLSGMAEVRIENVQATPVSPWGRIVVDYTVAGDLAADIPCYDAVVTASNRMTGTVYAGGMTEGETALTPGKHRVWWNARAAGLGEAAEAVDVRVAYEGPTYCVVDLSGGVNAESYPVSYLLGISPKGWTDEYKTTKLVLRRIPAGSFIMRSDQTNESCRVTLTKPFYMGIFEVTQKQWKLVMGSRSWPADYSPSSFNGCGDAYPAYNVSYTDIGHSKDTWFVYASSFLGKLRAKTGLDFVLPTEAQWEYACRAGTTTTYYWGDEMDSAYAWYWDNSGSKTHPVGTKKPNAWGLYDMSGNVWEWCRDWYGTLDYGTNWVNPEGPLSGSQRVLRGGSRNNSADCCTSFCRIGFDPSYRNGIIGFRLICAPPHATRGK